MLRVLHQAFSGDGTLMNGKHLTIDHETQVFRATLDRYRASSVLRRNGIANALERHKRVRISDAFLFQYDVVLRNSVQGFTLNFKAVAWFFTRDAVNPIVGALVQPRFRFGVEALKIGKLATDKESLTHETHDTLHAPFRLRSHRKVRYRTKSHADGQFLILGVPTNGFSSA